MSKVIILRLEVEPSPTGLFYVTSPDFPGLLVAECSIQAALANVAQALKDLEEARA